MASGVPAATSRPPAVPPSGPRSMTQSAAAMTSTWCSTTTTVWPASIRRSKIRSSRCTSSACKPGRRFVHQEQRAAGLGPGERLGQDEALAFAARQRPHGLADCQVAQPDIEQRAQAARDGPAGARRCAGVLRERPRGGDVHVEHVGQRAPANRTGEHLRAEPPPAAVLARRPDVRQEVHADAREPEAFTGLAPSAFGGGREVRLLESARAGLGEWRRRGRAVRRACRPRRPANSTGRWPRPGPPPCTTALEWLRANRAPRQATGADGVSPGVERGGHRRRDHVEHQRGLAAARDARHRHETAGRHVDVERREIVARTRRRRGGRTGAAGGCGRGEPAGQDAGRSSIAPRAAIAAGVPSATIVPPSAPAPGPSSMTWSAAPITSRSCSTTTTVLPSSRRPRNRSSSVLRVARMQAHGGFVEHVRDAGQAGPKLGRQPHPLRFASRQRGGAPVEGQVAEPGVTQPRQPAHDVRAQTRRSPPG